jgi:hypothetical protein
MSYDRIDWHSGGEYPDDLPPENGGIHIGMFLAWAFGQGMAGEVHREDSAKELEQLAKREITGLDFLIEAGDEKFWEMDLDERGNAFTIDYYYDANSAFARQHGSYLDDYCHVFNRHAADHGFEYPSIYHVENTWENFERLKPVLDQRFAQWQRWSEEAANRELGPHAQFINACQAVGQLLASHGFEPAGNGKAWKKTAADRDTVFEVSFQPESYNTRSKVQMTVHVRIASEQLRAWLAERTGRAGDGSVLSGSLRRPGKASSTIIWQVAGVEFRASVQAIRQSLEERVLPLFALFGDRPRVLEHLAARGGGFPGVCEPESTPMAFMLCFGTREQAQRFFAYYVGSWPARRVNIVKTFTRLREGGDIAWNHWSYFREDDVKLAFSSGLTLPLRRRASEGP